MGTKHTPLPWTIDTDGTGRQFAIVTSTHDADGPDDDVCEVYGGNADDYETRVANAVLIVNAVNSRDDLLAACKMLLWYYETFRDSTPKGPTELDDIASARAAIAKAEGQDGTP